MTNGWQAVGVVALRRRRRLGLKQNELEQYGGPGVSTVGKFERAAQESFPLRTQHQIEKALGWTRGTIEEVVAAYEAEAFPMDDWEHELIYENVPDLSPPSRPEPREWDNDEDLDLVTGLLRKVPLQEREAAVRAVFSALVPYMQLEGSSLVAVDDPKLSVAPDTTDDVIAADEKTSSITGEQEESDTP